MKSDKYLFWKYLLDKTFALFFIVIFIPFLLLIYILSILDTMSNGIFLQKRVGQFGKLFSIYKFKTINDKTKKISKFGAFLRKLKIDEFPQLFNILIGDMSFVGPRPDISGYYDKLTGENRKVLQLRPGLTSMASIKYRNEEMILKQVCDPLKYNDETIFPDKVKLNLEYLDKISFKEDFKVIIKTCESVFRLDK